MCGQCGHLACKLSSFVNLEDLNFAPLASLEASDFLDEHWEVGQVITYTFNVSSALLTTMTPTYQMLYTTALNRWAEVSGLTFQEVTTTDADYRIGFDADSDGGGGVLGYNINFDFDGDGILETGNNEYSLTAMDPNDLEFFYSTALHEAGHALGLAHNDDESSIMETFLNSLTDITAADIANIQSIYGASDSSTTTTTTTSNSITGTSDADILAGSSSSDTIAGGSGNDTLSGAGSGDVLYGNLGLDLMIGGSGNDTLFGGQNVSPANDVGLLVGGTETLSGGSGDDVLYGNFGGDSLIGGSGSDTLFGGQNDDTLSGGSSADNLFGNLGDDVLVGGSGADTFSYTGGGNDTITDFDFGDGDRLAIPLNFNGNNITSSSDILALVTSNSSGQAFIDFGDGNSITISNKTSSVFISSDFIVL